MNLQRAISFKDDIVADRCGGRIHFGNSKVRLPCIVKALTQNSARLHVFNSGYIPSRFWLSIEELGLEEECEIIMRTHQSVTVAFGTSTFLPETISDLPKSIDTDLMTNDEDAVLQRDENVAPELWVVEDDEDDCLILSEAFRETDAPCQLNFFQDGIAFLEHLDQCDEKGDHQTDRTIILLDINMPRMDGLTALTKLRERPSYRHLPVLMFTTSGSEDDIHQAYELGISAYITKPNNQHDLRQVVDFISNFWSSNVKLPAQ